MEFKFQVGDMVRIVGNSSYAGRIGEVIEDDGEEELPYNVKFDENNTWLSTCPFDAVELEKVSE